MNKTVGRFIVYKTYIQLILFTISVIVYKMAVQSLISIENLSSACVKSLEIADMRFLFYCIFM